MDSIFLYEDDDLSLIDNYQLLQKYEPYHQIPTYWFNIHHTYDKSDLNQTQTLNKNNKNQLDEIGLTDKCNKVKLSSQQQLDSDAYYFKDEFINKKIKDQLQKIKLDGLKFHHLQHYQDQEPSRPKHLLYQEKQPLIELVDMLDSWNIAGLEGGLKLELNLENFTLKENITNKIATTIPLNLPNILNQPILNFTGSSYLLNINGFYYLIPPYSKLLISTLNSAYKQLSIISKHHQFQTIILDPPFPNLSVERSKHYKAKLDLYDLYKLPIKDLLVKEGGYVGIWITNRKRVLRFVVNKLIKSWDLKLIGQIIWVKVTTQMNQVISLDSKHRQTFERMLVAVSTNSKASQTFLTRFLYAVPCKIHSRKPIVQDYLKRWFPIQSEEIKMDQLDSLSLSQGEASPPIYLNDLIPNLELFGRNLLPNTMTWGNEPIKFNQNEF